MIKLARNDSSNRWVSVRKSIQNVFVPNSSAENCLLLCEWHIKWSHRRNPLLCCALDIPHMEVANNATARSTPILCPLKHLFIERWRFSFLFVPNPQGMLLKHLIACAFLVDPIHAALHLWWWDSSACICLKILQMLAMTTWGGEVCCFLLGPASPCTQKTRRKSCRNA